MVSSVHSVDMLDNGVTHILCGMQQDDVSLHRGTQDGPRLKANGLLISGFFPCNTFKLAVIETAGMELDKWSDSIYDMAGTLEEKFLSPGG